MKKESTFQNDFIKLLRVRFPGIVVIKSESGYIQGFPDLILLYNDKWAVVECKRDGNSSRRPNQEYYVNLLNNMSYSSFVFKENETEVIHALEQTFESFR